MLEVLSVLGRGSQGAIYKVTNGSATYAAKLAHLRSISLDLITEFDILFSLDQGWSGGAKVLGKLSVPGRPTSLDDSRARAFCACSRCG